MAQQEGYRIQFRVMTWGNCSTPYVIMTTEELSFNIVYSAYLNLCNVIRRWKMSL